MKGDHLVASIRNPEFLYFGKEGRTQHWRVFAFMSRSLVLQTSFCYLILHDIFFPLGKPKISATMIVADRTLGDHNLALLLTTHPFTRSRISFTNNVDSTE